MAEQDLLEHERLTGYIAAIEAAIEDEDLDEAEARLEEAIAELGALAELLVLRADLALEAEEYTRCIEAVDKALEVLSAAAEPNAELQARALSHKGYALYYRDEMDAARQAFNASVHLNDSSWTALVGRAMVHDFLQYQHAALIDLDRAIELDDQEGQPFAIRGMIKLRGAHLDDARRDLQFALDSDPDDEESRLNLARLLALDNDSAGAREVLELLVDEGEDPKFVAPGALLRSQLALGLGSADAAAGDAQVAIDLLPDQPWGYLALAAAHITGGRAGEAIAAIKEAESRTKNPLDFPDIFALRAAAYDQLGKPDKVQEEQSKAEGVARLPEFVYGPILNPSQNVPLNPNKPIDVRGIMRQIFGDADAAPPGYEAAIRQVIDQIPQLIEQHKNVGKIEIELPPVQGMAKAPGNLVIQLNRPQS